MMMMIKLNKLKSATFGLAINIQLIKKKKEIFDVKVHGGQLSIDTFFFDRERVNRRKKEEEEKYDSRTRYIAHKSITIVCRCFD